MSRPAYLSQPNIQRLPNLLRDVREGEIRVPRFQRPFVWTTEQRLLLLQSIYEGMPIGSFLIWRTKEQDLQCYDRLGPLHLAWSSRDSEEEEGGIRQYLLDGHQRLTTLYVALGEGLLGGEPLSYPSDRDSGAVEEAENWPLFFDLEEKTFKINRKRTKAPDTWLPLSILFDPTKLYGFQKRLLEVGVERGFVNRAESLASTFKDYSIPVVPIVTEDLELATESFQRVNSGGTRMDEVHMVSALTWTPEFDLNERMKEIKTELGEVGWEDLEEKMILNTCKAFLDLDIYNAEAQAIKKALRERPEVLDKSTRAIKGAARFLREQCKVYGPVTLPYSLQIVLLADALQIATDGFKRELRSDLSAAIKSWFWLTTYGEHFSGISAGRLAKTVEHLRKVVKDGAKPEPPEMVQEVSWPRRFNLRTARSRAFALRLADLQVEYAATHFDPHQLLEEHGRSAVPTLVTAKELPGPAFEGPENRILVHPKEVTNVRRLLRGRPAGIDLQVFENHGIDNAAAENLGPLGIDLQLYESYGIDGIAAEMLIAGELSEFLDSRRLMLALMEREFVESLGLSYNVEP